MNTRRRYFTVPDNDKNEGEWSKTTSINGKFIRLKEKQTRVKYGSVFNNDRDDNEAVNRYDKNMKSWVCTV